MDRFSGRIAVITGGGTGMGRELARQLAADGCHVAMCDVSAENMERTRELCLEAAPEGSGVRVTCTLADVSDEAQVLRFRDAVLREHETDHIHLLFNNAGIGAAGSFLADPREHWEKTFNVCWGGVYLCSRAFVPLLVAADAGHIINTSSVNGFWASMGPTTPHTAYSAAKFAVKGFSEALIADLRVNAPHVQVSLVMPGHIGTDIATNSFRAMGRDPKEMSADDLAAVRKRMRERGGAAPDDDEQLRQAIIRMAESFRDNAPMTAAEAATVILDGVRAGRWRILVGEDAKALDVAVRQAPEDAYAEPFMERVRQVFALARG